ncbi:hypothetical protein LOK49_LG05G03930 [Camellia lanceoleosa]|uniref:Uncharacterized protein n=1 Tax=Camellia lanceoleosa TaxID=1840588 RepID=A0ACC0HU06_9ERIC|nr:hypothetical protein LOK49_LG05G03930 [Camellia lanceoleosa]
MTTNIFLSTSRSKAGGVGKVRGASGSDGRCSHLLSSPLRFFFQQTSSSIILFFSVHVHVDLFFVPNLPGLLIAIFGAVLGSVEWFWHVTILIALLSCCYRNTNYFLFL